MASSSLSVVGSGLDIPTLVSQLVANERKPAADRINTQGSTVTAKLSALGSIKSSLSSMQSALDALIKGASNQAYKTSVPEGSGFGATVVTDATTGAEDASTEDRVRTNRGRAGVRISKRTCEDLARQPAAAGERPALWDDATPGFGASGSTAPPRSPASAGSSVPAASPTCCATASAASRASASLPSANTPRSAPTPPAPRPTPSRPPPGTAATCWRNAAPPSPPRPKRAGRPPCARCRWPTCSTAGAPAPRPRSPPRRRAARACSTSASCCASNPASCARRSATPPPAASTRPASRR